MPPWFSDSPDPLVDDLPSFFDDDEPLENNGLADAQPGTSEGKREESYNLSAAPPQTTSLSLPRTRSVSLSSGQESNGVVDHATIPLDHRHNVEVRLPQSTLIIPRSRTDNWVPPVPRAREDIALQSLMKHLPADLVSQDFIEFELDQFSIYVESALYPCEMRPLQQLSTKGPDEFFFDGILGNGGLKFYVKRVRFSELPLGNYGPAHASIDDQIWIGSQTNATNEVYYKLKTPSLEYRRFYTPFRWVADLAKHVIDFCSHLREKKAVTLRHFQKDFATWLRKTHSKSPSCQRWIDQHGSDDLRSAISANVEFIWKEACGVLGYQTASSLQVFKEIRQLTRYRPFSDVLGDKRNPVQPSTIVTPYIYKCFGHTEFGELLELFATGDRSGDAVSENRPDFKTANQLQQSEVDYIKEANRRDLSATRARKQLIDNIKPGDTLSTPPDGAGTGTKWKKEVAKGSADEHRWFALVQRVHVSPKNGSRTFDVTWLYRPVDTPCGRMVYPWSKELFLSDHCTCEEGRDARVDEDEVLAVHKVDWFGSPEKTPADIEFFVRQTYQVEQRRWVALERKHMKCAHDKDHRLGYESGDTVLVAASDDRADAFEVVKAFKQGNNRFVRLRRLLRRCEADTNVGHIGSRPNELVYTDEFVVVKPQRILGRCIVRVFGYGEAIPCPYDRNGTANVFFITHRLQDGVCIPFTDSDRPPTLRQGFNPKRRVQKLKGLDLFCGSGNFGRGLEEGGVVDMCWTNDIWTEAIHTYMVNAPHHTKPFLGSVDDLLRAAIEGGRRDIPKRGEVDFISGGSPCQGFSLITADKTHDRQKKNRSLVASFASFVDFYRPRFGILENVLNIVQTGRNRDEDAFSQLICAIVGLGYQTQLTLGDAWTYGAPQSRSRAFLYFAAPGHRLPDPPRPSHSHFDGVKSRGLGKMTNGESFVSRSFDPTPFEFISAAEATADLPEIHDAKPDYCIGFPDHRVSIGVTSRSRHQYNRIPTQPYSMNFVKTWNGGKGIMTPAEREIFPPTGQRVSPISQGWGRVNPTGVFHTITTSVTPTDSRTGRFLHWKESRPLTILEARRAQGFPDHEVLVGSLTSQYELVGNSVARQMALALGLQFREAWLGTLYDDSVPVAVGKKVTDAGLRELPMNGLGVDEPQDMEPQLSELDADQEPEWEDDGSSSSDISEAERGTTTMETPPTSISGSEFKLSRSPPRKRPLSQSLGVEMHKATKLRKVEVRAGNASDAGAVVGMSTAAAAVEKQHIDLTVIDEPSGLTPSRELSSELVAVQSSTSPAMSIDLAD